MSASIEADPTDGKTIHKIQGDFRKGKINILMLNSRHQGAGHNLEKATRVILFHAHPSYVQVIGRAQRYGREGSLEVISLLYDHANPNYSADDYYNTTFLEGSQEVFSNYQCPPHNNHRPMQLTRPLVLFYS